MLLPLKVLRQDAGKTGSIQSVRSWGSVSLIQKPKRQLLQLASRSEKSPEKTSVDLCHFWDQQSVALQKKPNKRMQSNQFRSLRSRHLAADAGRSGHCPIKPLFLERRLSGLSSVSKAESATSSSATKRISLSCIGVHARRTKQQLANCFRWLCLRTSFLTPRRPHRKPPARRHGRADRGRERVSPSRRLA
jgi:hypothetical protein